MILQFSSILLAQQGNFLGLSFLGWVVAIVAALLIVDFFLQSDVLSLAAYAALSGYSAWILPLHPVYRILIGCLIFAALLWGHYALWKSVLSRFVNERLAPDKYLPGASGLVGRSGTVRDIEGQRMLEVQGDLWPMKLESALVAGDRAVVVDVDSGLVIVRKEEE